MASPRRRCARSTSRRYPCAACPPRRTWPPSASSSALPPLATSQARPSASTAMSSISEARPTQRLVARHFARLMPLLGAGYILNFLDRTNIALAKSALQHDVGSSPAAYGLGAGLFFL